MMQFFLKHSIFDVHYILIPSFNDFLVKDIIVGLTPFSNTCFSEHSILIQCPLIISFEYFSEWFYKNICYYDTRDDVIDNQF